LNLALVDAAEDLSRARLLPAGYWREPVTQLRRADAVIVTRAEANSAREPLAAQLRQQTAAPIFYAAHELTEARCLATNETQPLATFLNQPVGAFTGIARPATFFADLARAGLRLVWQRSFADHHRYDLPEAHALLAAAQQAGASAVLTTEKDAANLPAELIDEAKLWVTPLRFRCFDEEGLRAKLLAAVKKP
jgi:tetraacyldisaccharide 4'-kinase